MRFAAVSNAGSLPGAIITFVVAFTVLIAATVAAWSLVPRLADDVKHIQLAERPDFGEYYLAHDRGGHVDHHVLFHGTDAQALQQLEAADVLFLGNSRLMFAIRSRVLVPFFAERGLRPYMLGFGFREGDEFPLAIIRKFDLRPRLVVVNADNFFGRGRSEWAARVMKDSAFEARKLQLESEFGHEVRRVVHELAPNWFDLYGRPGFETGREFIAYRSRSNGTWFVSPWPDPVMTVPSGLPPGGGAGRRPLDAARRFKAELDARGIGLVLTFVPTPEPVQSAPRQLAEALGVPLIAPDTALLTSHDGSHLSEDSAVIWSRAFLEALAPYLPEPRTP